MSLMNVYPIQAFSSEDENAPPIGAQNLDVVFKSCLIEGYGDKKGAGWSLINEDLEQRTKVFKAPDLLDAHPLFLKLHRSQDGRCLISMGMNEEAEHQSNQPFQFYHSYYAPHSWRAYVSDVGLFFWTSARYHNLPHKRGHGFFLCRVRAQSGDDYAFLAFTGGNYSNADHVSPFFSNSNGHYNAYPLSLNLRSNERQNITRFYYPFGEVAYQKQQQRYLGQIHYLHGDEIIFLNNLYSVSRHGINHEDFYVEDKRFIYYYLDATGSNDDNPSYHTNQLAVIAADEWFF